MFDSLVKLLIGDLGEKRAYKQLMKRVDALPSDYRYAFRKIQHYMFSVGGPEGDTSVFNDLTMFTNLVELFEASAAEGKAVLDVTGSDVASFSDEFMRVPSGSADSMREKINREILEHFKKESNNHA